MDQIEDTSASEVGMDIFGQQPALGLYTQISLIYCMKDASQEQGIRETLKEGLQKLAQIPWLCGNVVPDVSNAGITGTFKIIPAASCHPIRFADLRENKDAASFPEMQAAAFPFRMLDEGIFAPRNTIPGTSGEPVYNDMPCFLVQASFINGGLVLTFNAQHQTMDVVGQAEAIRLLSKACQGRPFDNQELSIANMPRNGYFDPVINGSDGEVSGKGTIAQPDPQAAPIESSHAPQPAKCSWTYFRFSGPNLKELKIHATLTKSSSNKFISTDDALTALVWRSVMRAGQQRLGLDTTCKMTRAIDVRRFFGLPDRYPGMCQSFTLHSSTIRALTSSPLGEIASIFRAAIDPDTTTVAKDTRSLLSRLAAAKDKSTASFISSFGLDTERDLLLSSWAKVDLTEADFGMGLGAPVAVRRPQLIPYGNLCYLLPKAKNGEILLGICLRDEELQRMRADDEFMKYAEDIP